MTSDQFSSVYSVLLHSKSEVWFALHSLMKYVPLDKVEEVFRKAGFYHPKGEDEKMARYVCVGLRWFNTNARTGHLIDAIGDYAKSVGKGADFARDYDREMAYDSWDGCM